MHTPGAMDGQEGFAEPPPYGVAALVGAAILVLYIVSIAPTTQFWDTSEYIAAAKVLGIPHPPGNPLFVLVASVWGMIPFAEHYALRINLFAACTSAAASAFLFLAAHRLLRPVVEAPGPRRAAAFAGTLVGATMFTVWNQSVVNEKVYTVSLLSIALGLWLALRWGDTEPGARRDRYLLLAGYLAVLTSTNHMMGVLVAPAILVYVALTDWRAVLEPWVVAFGLLGALAVSGKWTTLLTGPTAWRIGVGLAIAAAFVYVAWRTPRAFARPVLWMALLAVIVGISLNYGFLPIRAAAFPPINEGEPTSWQSLLAVLEREQYQKPPLTHRQASLDAQLLNYWQYFSWQFAHDWGPRLRNGLAAGFALLGLLGGAIHWRRDRRGAAAMTALIFTLTILLVYYLNFRYGYSIWPGQELDREVRERDYFFVASFQVWSIWVGLGLGYLLAQAHALFRERLAPTAAWYAAAPVLLLALIPLIGNRLTAPRSGETLARDFAVDLLQSLEPYAIVITAGDNDLFPLWYAQEVEGVRPDVLIANQSLMNTEWHIRQLIRREIFRFDPERAAAPFRDRVVSAPREPPLALSLDDVATLPPYWEVPRRAVLRVGTPAGDTLIAVLEPNVYSRSDRVTLELIAENLGERPIYFARTTGPTADRLGLTEYLVAEGFARRLQARPVEPSDSLVVVPALGWIDLDRTETLLFDVYHAESAARERPRGWIDRPSQNILSLYYVTYWTFARIIEQIVDPADTARQRAGENAARLAERMFDNLQLGQ